jgi:molybdate transport system substrate-binding protein
LAPEDHVKTRATLFALLLVLAGACGDDAGGDASDTTVRVFAAASLTDALGELATAFEGAHPGTEVELNLAGSSALREQILSGAPADVFASANTQNMQAVVDAGLAVEPDVFVLNELQIVVPAGNPAGIESLDDFGDESLLIGLCAVEVPCGAFARQALDAAGVDPEPDTEEPDVRALLTKVAAGELDAGIVYRTDVLSAGDDVEGIDIPADVNVVAEYPIATLTESSSPDVAADFVAFAIAEDGQAILRSYGFGSP